VKQLAERTDWLDAFADVYDSGISLESDFRRKGLWKDWARNWHLNWIHFHFPVAGHLPMLIFGAFSFPYHPLTHSNFIM